MSHGPETSIFKQCKGCHTSKGLDAYYIRSHSRFDPVCIECRLIDKKKKYQSKKNTTPSKRIIEPKSIQKKYIGSNTDTVTLVQNCDFSDIEKNSGKMTVTQKHEIIQRFNEFITILRDGYGEMLGCEVYVKKD